MGSPPSPVLRALDLGLFSRDNGQAVLSPQNKTLLDNQIVAGVLAGSTCGGDSGGPLLYSPCKMTHTQKIQLLPDN